MVLEGGQPAHTAHKNTRARDGNIKKPLSRRPLLSLTHHSSSPFPDFSLDYTLYILIRSWSSLNFIPTQFHTL